MSYNQAINSGGGARAMGMGASNALSSGISALSMYLQDQGALDLNKLTPGQMGGLDEATQNKIRMDNPDAGSSTFGGSLYDLAGAGIGGRGFQNGMKLSGALSGIGGAGAAAGKMSAAGGAAGGAAGAGAAGAGAGGALSAL
jgi:hypothetical protein